MNLFLRNESRHVDVRVDAQYINDSARLHGQRAHYALKGTRASENTDDDGNVNYPVACILDVVPRRVAHSTHSPVAFKTLSTKHRDDEVSCFARDRPSNRTRIGTGCVRGGRSYPTIFFFFNGAGDGRN